MHECAMRARSAVPLNTCVQSGGECNRNDAQKILAGEERTIQLKQGATCVDVVQHDACVLSNLSTAAGVRNAKRRRSYDCSGKNPISPSSSISLPPLPQRLRPPFLLSRTVLSLASSFPFCRSRHRYPVASPAAAPRSIKNFDS